MSRPTKRKARKPRDIDGPWGWIAHAYVNWDGKRDFDLNNTSGHQPVSIAQTKRLIAWLRRALAWQKQGK